MPFTLAHPIATLPLWHASHKRLDLPALIVGSTIPDIAFYIALHPVVNVGHSLSGIFTEGIPSALLLLFLGRYLLWRPVLALLPNNIAHRLPVHCPYQFLPINRLLVIILSVALGALTHIIWDNFTHDYGWAVKQFSFLSAEVANLPIYKCLQYGGGLVGFTLVVALLYATLRKQTPQYTQQQLSDRGKGLAWSFITAIFGLTIYAAIAQTSKKALSNIVVNTIVGSISGLFLGLCLYAAIFWANQVLEAQSSSSQ
ncbi:MAG: DUF4184 family protein [Cyanobacteria bacterium P01_F01_bin.53]